ncbi:MAG: hypothetical protein ACKVVT_10535 [Dehalococcoidia bacterium]
MSAIRAPWDFVWRTPMGALAAAVFFLVLMLATFIWTGPLLGLPAIGFSARWKLLQREAQKARGAQRSNDRQAPKR